MPARKVESPGGGSGIRIVAVQGTNRPGNFTARALALAVDEARKHADVQVELVDPAELQLPFPGQAGEFPDAARIKQLVADATGVILATPEYHGSFSSVLKLVIENLGFPSMLAGKPVALLGVAAGRIGAIKSLEQLRGVCSHVGAIVMPAAISVPHVRTAFSGEADGVDANVEKQVRSVASNLIDYIRGAVCPGIAFEELVRQGGR